MFVGLFRRFRLSYFSGRKFRILIFFCLFFLALSTYYNWSGVHERGSVLYQSDISLPSFFQAQSGHSLLDKEGEREGPNSQEEEEAISLSNGSKMRGVFPLHLLRREKPMRNGCFRIPERYYKEAKQGKRNTLQSRSTPTSFNFIFRVVVTRHRTARIGIHFFRKQLEYYNEYGYYRLYFEDLKGPTVRTDCRRYLNIDRDPDVIAFHFLEQVDHVWRDISSHRAYKFSWLHDLNYPQHIYPAVKYSKTWLDATFATYPETFTDLVSPEVHKDTVAAARVPKCFVLSNAASEEFVQKKIDFANKKRKALLSGSVDKHWYSLRHEALRLMESKFELIERRVGGGIDLNNTVNTSTNAMEYSKLINQYLLAIVGSTYEAQRRPYILAKTFEIPASGTAIIHDMFMVPYLREEGFEPYVHYIPATVETLKDVVREWLSPEKENEVRQITLAGQQLVLNRHLLENKFTAFLNFVNDQYHLKKRNSKLFRWK
eukprot:Nk52_evm16s684 gene=Nk52_evmTU16s684